MLAIGFAVIKSVKVFIKLFYAVKYFPLIAVWKKHDTSSKNVVLIYPNWPRKIIQYFYSDSLVADFSLIKAVAEEFDDFRIKLSLKNMARVLDSRVLFSIGYRFNVSNYRDYSVAISQFIEQMEEQGNRVIPNGHDVEWWENKAFMHRQFEKLEMKTPVSIIYDLHTELDISFLETPFLVKEVHSAGAKGLYKIDKASEFESLLNNSDLKSRNRYLIIQKLLRIDRDLRVALVGDEIYYHHWRINDDILHWEPTTYEKGKKGDFGNFPEDWREHIITEFKKTGLQTGAFDLAWENNDLSQAPYILEISPAYFPNPRPPRGCKKEYGDYKHGISFRDPWEKYFVRQSDALRKLVLKQYLASEKTVD